MKTSKISESQIITAIKEHESRKTAADINNWKKKYCSRDNQELYRWKELEEENRRLKPCQRKDMVAYCDHTPNKH